MGIISNHAIRVQGINIAQPYLRTQAIHKANGTAKVVQLFYYADVAAFDECKDTPDNNRLDVPDTPFTRKYVTIFVTTDTSDIAYELVAVRDALIAEANTQHEQDRTNALALAQHTFDNLPKEQQTEQAVADLAAQKASINTEYDAKLWSSGDFEIEKLS